MSYVSWHTYGYGIVVSDLRNVTYERVEKLIQRAPKYEKAYKDWLTQCGIAEPTLEAIAEFDEDYGLGLATTLREVILESEGVELTSCNDYDGKTYLLYEPSYPWWLKDRERHLTETDICSLLAKYVSIITDEPIVVDYQNPANGG